MTRTANMLMVFLLCLFLMADVSYCTSDVCRLPKVTGFCRAAFHRFYFNARTRRCEPFIYGGCGGNANNFGDKAHCLESCLGRQHVCQLPKVIGFCRAAFPRFYYNTQTRTCESFIYGGCGGNANNFEDKAQCQEFCLGRRRIVFPEKK